MQQVFELTDSRNSTSDGRVVQNEEREDDNRPLAMARERITTGLYPADTLTGSHMSKGYVGIRVLFDRSGKPIMD